MKLREAFKKAFGIKESSSSSSSSVMVPHYPDVNETDFVKRAENDIKNYVDPVAASKKKVKYDKDKCNPKTCWGECNGDGWCHIAQEWQKKIKHHNDFTKFIKIKKIKKGGSKKYKKNKKWKKIHQKKSKKFRRNF